MQSPWPSLLFRHTLSLPLESAEVASVDWALELLASEPLPMGPHSAMELAVEMPELELVESILDLVWAVG